MIILRYGAEFLEKMMKQSHQIFARKGPVYGGLFVSFL